MMSEYQFSKEYCINMFSMEFMDLEQEETFRSWSKFRWWKILKVNLGICAILNTFFAIMDWSSNAFSSDLMLTFVIRMLFSLGIAGGIFLIKIIKNPALIDYFILAGSGIYSLAVAVHIHYSKTLSVNASMLLSVILALYLLLPQRYLYTVFIGIVSSSIFILIIIYQVNSTEHPLRIIISFITINIIATLYLREMHYQRRKSFFEFIREIQGRLALEEEIVKREDAERKLIDLANKDSLTNVYNRRAFFEMAKNEFSRTKRYGIDLSLFMIDVDFFKNINDTFGHSVGDGSLCFLAKTIQQNIRDSDILARVGGEEFCVLLPETNSKGAIMVANKIRLAIERNSQVNDVPITISIGVAGYLDERSFDHLYIKADEALYRAKENGRNRVEVAPE